MLDTNLVFGDPSPSINFHFRLGTASLRMLQMQAVGMALSRGTPPFGLQAAQPRLLTAGGWGGCPLPGPAHCALPEFLMGGTPVQFVLR